MRIKLETWEYEWACAVGISRYTANWNKNDAEHYKKERMEDDRTASVAAAVCELAVAKASNTYWSGHVWPADEHETQKHRADVGQRSEVRRTRNGKTIAVRRKQLNKGLIIWGCMAVMPELREVDVYGYLDHDQAWALAEPSDFDPDNTRYVSIQYLNQLDQSRAVL
jgi:hypothetical protein